MPVEARTESFNAPSSDFRADSLLVWDMHKYARLLRETDCWTTVWSAMVNDGLGLVTEKISSEKDDHGNYIFDPETRIRLQLTPAQNAYYEVEDQQTGEKLMVPPELLGVKKDIMKVIGPWRRGLDQKVMAVVRDVFLNNPEQKGPIIWTSTKAEAEEGPEVCACNGQYGWLYIGHTDVDEHGLRRLTVYNYKYPGSADVAMEFIHRGAEQIHYAEEKQPTRLSDEAMTTVVTANPEINWDSGSVWQHLSSIQQEVNGQDKIFGLSVETIIKLQDPKLHQFLKEAVAKNMAKWMINEMRKGMHPDQIQDQVRQRFIESTKLGLRLYLENDLYGGRKVGPVVNRDEVRGYTGSNGDGCGDWGEAKPQGKSEYYCKRCGNCGLLIETEVKPGEKCPGVPKKGIPGCGAVRVC